MRHRVIIMAVGHGFLCSRNFLLILHIYLVFGGTTLNEQRNKSTDFSRAIRFISEDIACSKPHSRRTTVKHRPLTNSTLFILGARLFLNSSVATILLCLSGDVESNPGPKFEINISVPREDLK